jgi:ABC-type phosphate/phosphonate transport system substrate-binding protein
MIASLPMYDLPELRQSTEAWWLGLATWWRRLGLTSIPDALEHPVDRYAHWLDSSLFFSQTCGYPLTHLLKNKVSLVATPCYRAQGCLGATYRSAIITRSELGIVDLAGLKGARAAVNDYDSQSGWNVFRHALRRFGAAERFFGSIIATGAHRNSVTAVRSGAADAAAIDCVTYELLRANAPDELIGVSVVAWSDPAPSLPFISRADIDGRSLAILRDGLQAACSDPGLGEVRDRLLISGISVLPVEAYNVILNQEGEIPGPGSP